MSVPCLLRTKSATVFPWQEGADTTRPVVSAKGSSIRSHQLYQPRRGFRASKLGTIPSEEPHLTQESPEEASMTDVHSGRHARFRLTLNSDGQPHRLLNALAMSVLL